MRKVGYIFLFLAACAPQGITSPTPDRSIPASRTDLAVTQSTTDVPLSASDRPSPISPTSFPTAAPKPTTAHPTPTPTVPVLLCRDTDTMAGTSLTCCIQRAYCSYRPDIKGRPTFCNDAPYPNHHFTLLVWGQDWSEFDGMCIDVSGLVSRYRGKPEIIAETKSQVSQCR